MGERSDGKSNVTCRSADLPPGQTGGKVAQETWRLNTMSTKDLLEEALKLRPEERFTLLEGIIMSLDEPDKKLDAIWAEEAEKRLKAYREGALEGIPMEDIFKDE